MSFLHLVYIGDFERDGASVRFTNSPDNPILKPVVHRPLEPDQLTEFLPIEASGGIPDDWRIWALNGYLACDRYDLGSKEIAFLRHLVEQAGCQVVDFNARAEISIDELCQKREAVSVREGTSASAG